MLNITELAEELKEQTAWQATPEPLSQQNYERLILKGIRRLYIDTGRAEAYDDSYLISGMTFENLDSGCMYFNYNFPVDEIAYIMLCSQISFFQKVQGDVNNIIGYSTDALTVTNADKPYANLKDTIEKLENDRRILYYKMVRYAIGE